MEKTEVLQGRITTEEDIEFVRQLIKENPSWHRSKLAVELAKIWNWRDKTGRLKDMASRTFMLKLHRAERIVLPAPLRAPVVRKKVAKIIPHSREPIAGSLQEILPVKLSTVAPGTESAQLFRCFLAQYHYLDYRGSVGKNICYLASDNKDRPLACFLFGAAAWKTAPRDLFIGWNRKSRADNLEGIAGNNRFLILPWVTVPNLASHLLGLLSRRISRDWIEKYNHPLYLLETFVQKDRFIGTCYKSANWIYLGDTTGRTRNGRSKDAQSPIKEVYVYPLHRRFRDLLCAEDPVPN